MFLSKIPEILSILDKFRNSGQIFAKFRLSGLKKPKFPSPTGDLDSAIPSKFSSNSAIPDEKRVDSAPPPTVKPPPPHKGPFINLSKVSQRGTKTIQKTIESLKGFQICENQKSTPSKGRKFGQKFENFG